MHKKEKFRERNFSSKSSRKSDKKNRKIMQIPQVLLPNFDQSTSENMKHEKKLQNILLIPSLMTDRKIHQVLLPNLYQSTHERISNMEKTLQNTLLIPSLRVGNAIENLLMTAQIKTDFVNHLVPSTTEPSTSLLRVGTDACESIINSILRCKDYDFHNNILPR
ncbi:uncharacterized protein TNCV_2195841 [Trichonephila clavipes]|nr:uncharacterized protein TNCV_2195841 [Trichonephila clavipes]